MLNFIYSLQSDFCGVKLFFLVYSYHFTFRMLHRFAFILLCIALHLALNVTDFIYTICRFLHINRGQH